MKFAFFFIVNYFILQCSFLFARIPPLVELPPLSDYEGRAKMAFEIEVNVDGLAKIVTHFDAGKANHVDPFEMAKNIVGEEKITKRMQLRSFPKGNWPKDWSAEQKEQNARLQSVFSTTVWEDDEGVTEFKTKKVHTDPQVYLETLETLASELGVWKNLQSPLESFEDVPWYSFHQHLSLKGSKNPNIKNVFRLLNLLRIIEYAEVGLTKYAMEGGYSHFDSDIEAKAQVRLVSKKRGELRRQSMSPEEELKRTFYLMDIPEQESVKMLLEEIHYRLTPDIKKSIRKRMGGSFYFTELMEVENIAHRKYTRELSTLPRVNPQEIAHYVARENDVHTPHYLEWFFNTWRKSDKDAYLTGATVTLDRIAKKGQKSLNKGKLKKANRSAEIIQHILESDREVLITQETKHFLDNYRKHLKDHPKKAKKKNLKLPGLRRSYCKRKVSALN